jgi:LacI family transcriptional regulator
MNRISIKDIARLAKVSRGTVDRALHGRGDINDETRQRIVRIASECHYQPHPAARMLVIGRAPVAIGVCIPREIRFFFDQVRDGILREAQHFESVGFSALYHPFERYGMGERGHIEETIKHDIKALIVSPGIDPSVGGVIDEAEKRGIRVVCVAGDVADCRRSAAVCSNPELNGRCAAELLGKFMCQPARVVVFTGMLQHQIHSREVKSFSKAFSEFSAGGKVIEVIENHESEQEAFEKCASLLQRVRDLNAIYISTVNCLPICAALDAAGLADKVKLITTDLFPDMVPWFERKTILASVHQQPFMQGQTAVRLIVDHIVSGVPFPPICYLNPLVALQSNLCMFREISSQNDAEPSVAPLRSMWVQA